MGEGGQAQLPRRSLHHRGYPTSTVLDHQERDTSGADGKI